MFSENNLGFFFDRCNRRRSRVPVGAIRRNIHDAKFKFWCAKFAANSADAGRLYFSARSNFVRFHDFHKSNGFEGRPVAPGLGNVVPERNCFAAPAKGNVVGIQDAVPFFRDVLSGIGF